MPETLTDAQKVLRNDTGKRIAVALEALASEVEPSTVIAPEYDATQTYAVGDLVIRRSVLYRCTTPIDTPEEWTTAHWTATMVSDAYRQAVDQDVIDANLMALGLTGASVGDLVRVAAVDANGKPTSWSHVPLCEIKTNPNLLDNWDFGGGGSQQGDGILPINQRGLTSYQNSGYTIDRWFLSGSSSSISIISDGLNISRSASGDTVIAQRLPDGLAKQLAGKAVTLSVKFKGQNSGTIIAILMSADGSTSQGVRVETGAAEGVVSATGVLPDDMSAGLSVRIVKRGAGNGIIEAVKLELGSEQTLAHWDGTKWVLNELPDYDEELAKCQHYLVVAKQIIYNRVGLLNANGLYFSIPLPQPLAREPVPANNDVTGISVANLPSGTQSGFTFAYALTGTNYLRVVATKTGHGLDDGTLVLAQGAIISAEL